MSLRAKEIKNKKYLSALVTSIFACRNSSKNRKNTQPKALSDHESKVDKVLSWKIKILLEICVDEL